MKNLIQISLLLFFFFSLINCSNSDSSEIRKEKTATKIQEDTKHKEKGQQIAAATFAALSQNLQKAMKSGGVPNAVQFCNLAAYPITDSLSQTHNASIRRTSLKYRNPNNQPNDLEKSILETYAKEAIAGKALQPMIKHLDNQKIAFFAPIKTNDLCLKCHGKVGETLKEEHHQLIQKHYPTDKAIDYVSGELRGMWSIEWAEK
jgi:hypothetical protein